MREATDAMTPLPKTPAQIIGDKTIAIQMENRFMKATFRPSVTKQVSALNSKTSVVAESGIPNARFKVTPKGDSDLLENSTGKRK